MKLANDGECLPRGAQKDPLQRTAAPAQEASKEPLKGIFILDSPISGPLLATLLL